MWKKTDKIDTAKKNMRVTNEYHAVPKSILHAVLFVVQI